MLTVMDQVIGQRIKMRREFKKLTQAELAKRCETSLQVVSQWETGHRTPGADGLRKLAKALRCSSDYLLGLVPRLASKGLDSPLEIEAKNIDAPDA